MHIDCRRIRVIVAIILMSVVGTIVPSNGFAILPQQGLPQFVGFDCSQAALLNCNRRIPVLKASRVSDSSSDVSAGGEEEDMTDEELLRQTKKEQLTDLCSQFGLSTKGTKEELLKRLRDYAEEQANIEKEKRKERRQRIEQGADNGKERYEVLSVEESDDSEDGDDDEVYFYYHDPNIKVETKPDENIENRRAKSQSLNSTTLTAPPPPPVEPDENGERVVTVYSTSDQNDLTGVAASQPGQAALNDPMTANLGGGTSDAPWEPENSFKGKASESELEAAKNRVVEVVHSLLEMTGAPAFQGDEDDEEEQLMSLGITKSSYVNPLGFVGFDPAQVPSDLLTAASKDIRAGRGQVLADVLHEYEMRAIGHDGMHGDDKEKGGGHYREVAKVRSFLEGFRKAEVRRVARETASMLLDKLVSEGIEGLDITLASMTRSSDDTSDGGELNDSLIDYLNEAIRQQEKKVEQLVDSSKNIEGLERVAGEDPDTSNEDQTQQLWKVESEDGTGERIETFDLNDPFAKQVLKEELEKSQNLPAIQRPTIPKAAAEKVLMLLMLVRERVKTEAAFMHDEKSRNLRVLAYCLHMSNEEEREQLIMREFGGSLDVSMSMVMFLIRILFMLVHYLTCSTYISFRLYRF